MGGKGRGVLWGSFGLGGNGLVVGDGESNTCVVEDKEVWIMIEGVWIRASDK